MKKERKIWNFLKEKKVWAKKFFFDIFFWKKRVRWKFKGVFGLEKTALDRIPRYRRTALKEECLYMKTFWSNMTAKLVALKLCRVPLARGLGLNCFLSCFLQNYAHLTQSSLSIYATRDGRRNYPAACVTSRWTSTPILNIWEGGNYFIFFYIYFFMKPIE